MDPLFGFQDLYNQASVIVNDINTGNVTVANTLYVDNISSYSGSTVTIVKKLIDPIEIDSPLILTNEIKSYTIGNDILINSDSGVINVNSSDISNVNKLLGTGSNPIIIGSNLNIQNGKALSVQSINNVNNIDSLGVDLFLKGGDVIIDVGNDLHVDTIESSTPGGTVTFASNMSMGSFALFTDGIHTVSGGALTFLASLNPFTDNFYSIGTSIKRFVNGYISNLFTQSITGIGQDLVLQNYSDPTKKLSINQGGSTTGTNITLATSNTVNRTLTLPDATDILIGRNTTDTLTNKTLTSPTINSPIFSGDLTTNNIYPATNLTYGIGQSSAKYSTGYIDTIHSSTVTDVSNITNTGAITFNNGVGPVGFKFQNSTLGNMSMSLSRSNVTTDMELCVANAASSFSSSVANVGDVVIRNNTGGTNILLQTGSGNASLEVNNAGGIKLRPVTGVILGYNPSILNCHQRGTISCTFIGAYTKTVSISYERTGTKVCLAFPDILGAATVNSVLSCNGALPSGLLRPDPLTYGSPSSVCFKVRCKSGGTFVEGLIDMFPSNGMISIYSSISGGNFAISAGSTDSGLTSCCITYLV